jgi:hypothetical protein
MSDNLGIKRSSSSALIILSGTEEEAVDDVEASFSSSDRVPVIEGDWLLVGFS